MAARGRLLGRRRRRSGRRSLEIRFPATSHTATEPSWQSDKPHGQRRPVWASSTCSDSERVRLRRGISRASRETTAPSGRMRRTQLLFWSATRRWPSAISTTAPGPLKSDALPSPWPERKAVPAIVTMRLSGVRRRTVFDPVSVKTMDPSEHTVRSSGSASRAPESPRALAGPSRWPCLPGLPARVETSHVPFLVSFNRRRVCESLSATTTVPSGRTAMDVGMANPAPVPVPSWWPPPPPPW
mmetsp:Transcript_50989/g.110811  ORF Transcript_50989/g.110811 Transcript_50989/m.110811 type:complete len:242 (+) Transcript_50989:407-1132(+)